MDTVIINGKVRNVERLNVTRDHGISIFWVDGQAQQWRCRLENGKWQPTYQIS